MTWGGGRGVLAGAIAIAILWCGAARADGPATLHGTLVDRATHQPVGGAVVEVGSELVASDDDGTFAVSLAPGSYTIVVTAPFLVTLRQPVTLTGDVRLTIEVDAAEASTGEQIEIIDIAPTAPGETKVTAKLARSVPGGGDAAKIVQSLPAVARPPAGSADIVVWGAAPHDTRVFVDGVPVMALYHVGGYRAAVGNDLVGDIHLTPAAFGPDRGGAIGGVIDIGLADPAAAPDWRAQADVLDASAAGKLKLGGATIAAAVRQSWLDHAIDVVADRKTLAPNAPIPTWTDGQVVVRVPIHDDLAITGWVLGSLDSLDRTLVSDDPATQVDERTDQRTVRAQITLRRDRPDGYDSATVWAGRDHTRYDLQVGLIPASQRAATWLAGARGVQQHRLSPAATVTYGADLDAETAALQRTGSLTIPVREGDLYIFGQPPGDDVAADRWNATTIDAAGHVALDLRAGRVTATLGDRFDAWMLGASRLTPRVGALPALGSQQLDFTDDPRGSLQVQLTGDASARVDAGLYHQAREASDTSAVFGTPDLGVEQAWHVTAGGQWRHAPFALEAAVYARWLDDLVARDLAVTPPLAQALTQGGTGRVLGLQVTARLVDWNHLTGWLSYSLSRSTRKDADTQPERLFDHDQTHGLIAVAGWDHGPWTLGGRLRLATGEPRTAVIGAFFDSRSGRFQPIVGPHNGTRLPTFFAADVRGERRFAITGGVRGAVYLEIQNLTDRANAEEIIYNADFSQHGYLTSLPLLAIGGVRIER
ncbi:MAG TPA: TonB-dependent receptor [Kofleriaceae bacterium]|nr:TonB-dependent receptor [Kofleriaceae bacterium]